MLHRAAFVLDVAIKHPVALLSWNDLRLCIAPYIYDMFHPETVLYILKQTCLFLYYLAFVFLSLHIAC